MLAGSAYTSKISAEGGRLSQLLKNGTPDEQVLEEFYLAALTRFPTPQEKAKLLNFLASAPPVVRRLWTGWCGRSLVHESLLTITSKVRPMKKNECDHCQGAAFTRRDFLRAGTLSFLGMNLSDPSVGQRTGPAATNPPAKAKAVILLWLEGGVSHLDTWDVKATAALSRFRPTPPECRSPRSFPGFANHMDKLSIIRSMKTDERNHPQSD